VLDTINDGVRCERYLHISGHKHIITWSSLILHVHGVVVAVHFFKLNRVLNYLCCMIISVLILANDFLYRICSPVTSSNQHIRGVFKKF